MLSLISSQSLYESVDFSRCTHDEIVGIARLVPKIQQLRSEERIWHEDFRQECFIILDHIDFLMYTTFREHERKLS